MTPLDVTQNTECKNWSPPINMGFPPPVPGAVPIARAHSHPTHPNEPSYGCDPDISPSGDTTYYSQFPADTANGKRPYVKLKFDSTDVASDGDWRMAITTQTSNYTIDASGIMTVADPSTIAIPRTYKWSPVTGKRCAWVR